MYIPMLWALFSKRHTGRSVLGITLVCLTVNSFFKWGGVFELTQAQAQALGSVLPLILMAAYELFAIRKGEATEQYLDYETARVSRLQVESQSESREEDELESNRENSHGIRVIGIGVLATGCLIIALGAVSDQGRLLVMGVGAGVALVGAGILRGKQGNG